MRFVREVSKEKITADQIKGLIADGFILKYKENTIEIWADCTPDASAG